MIRRHVILFSARFATDVACGNKRQTIRPPRIRTIAADDVLLLRAWEGRPYHSRQIDLALRACTHVSHVFISDDLVMVDKVGLASTELDAFARADGFANWAAMRAWFDADYGLPFSGQLICW